MNKYFIPIIIVLFLLLSTPAVIFAQVANGGRCSPTTDTCAPGPNGEVYACRYSPYGYFCAASAGALPANNKSLFIQGSGTVGVGTDSVGGDLIGFIGYAISPQAGDGGGLGQATNAISQLYYNKPAETAVAIAEFKRSINLPVKDAYAQTGGYGFRALNPILGIWRIMRNLALAGFVIIFVVIGFMLMLRSKIDPRTVVTVQQAIPKIVISLILVVFSYALCGLLVDATTLATRLGLLTLQNTGLIAQGNSKIGITDEQNAEERLNANIFELFDNLYNADVLINQLTTLGKSTLFRNDGFDTVREILRINIGTGNGILGVIIWIAIFTAMLRAFFMLLTAYLTITLKIIFSPFSFLFMAIPGSEGSIGSWARGMLRHLLVFPVVFFMLCFAAIFNAVQGSNTWVDSRGEQVGDKIHPNYWNVGAGPGLNPSGVFSWGTAYWSPPALGNWGLAVGPLLTLGIILTIPKASNLVQEAITPKSRPSAAEGAAGTAFKEAASKIPGLGSFMR